MGQVIFSPGWPGYYPNNEECIWNFHGDERADVTVHFTYFRLEHSNRCRYDSVRVIEDYTNVKATLCGTHPPLFYRARRVLTIAFKSDSSDTDRGFRAVIKYGSKYHINESLGNETYSNCVNQV